MLTSFFRGHELFYYFLLIISALQILHVSSSQYYCGQFTSATTAGAKGYFQIYTDSGTTTYTYELDLRSFSTSCPLSDGLTYQVHTYWTNTTSDSSAFEFCESDYTGEHYDPGLACSSKSQYSSTNCALLNRTEEAGYSYSCSEANYNSGAYALCEKGDLSSKLGLAYETHSNSSYFVSPATYFTSSLIDYDGPYPGNWKNDDDVTEQWSSIVIRCNSDGSRLLCANFVKSTTSCDEDSDEDSYYMSTWSIILLVIGGVLLVFAFGLLVYLYYPVWVEEAEESAKQIRNQESTEADPLI